MMNPVLPSHLAGNAFCFISSLLVAYQVCCHPNKLRIFILGYSILALPPSIINTLEVQDIVTDRSNSLVYLVSTLLMTVTHFFMILDVGYRLRVGDGNWKHPLVLIGILFVSCTSVLLVTEIFILALNSDGQQHFPLKGAFIAGVVCAILGDSSIFTYTFMPLIYRKKNRVNEGHSRTTALGICFFFIQNVWYSLYGALYCWFFVMNSFEKYMDTLLALDYVLRFVENLLYTWPPPKLVVDYLSSHLPSTSINLSIRNTNTTYQRSSSNNTAQQAMSSERYNKETVVEYGNPDEEADRKSISSDHGSRVTIVS